MLMKYTKQIKIKDVVLPSNLILAPMAGFTDMAFRKMCNEFGTGLVYTEMVSAKALSYKNKKTEDLLANYENCHPVAVQIFGHDPKVMAEVIASGVLDKFDIIDINMGCPAPKIVKNGDGSALLKNLALAREIISSCVAATNKPITVKFRIGYNADENIAVKFAKMCEEAGASAITVHGRTTEQGYSGVPNYEAIKQVKEAVNIPVFANGNVVDKESFERVMEYTKADGVMIGRAALGSPEIFEEILTNNNVKVNKLEQIKFHYNSLLNVLPERAVVLYMRAHLAHYLKGKFKNSKVLVELIKQEKHSEIMRILEEYFV